ncbi:MAG: GNAT family N-acetyltransferase [Clostridia bacterium]|nr:GNAT family N-acetyltransferase [Clostridia bacterium]
MIKKATKKDLNECLDVLHQAYDIVAKNFNITAQNSPYRGNADLPYEEFLKAYKTNLIFCYKLESKIAGIINFEIKENICRIHDLAVLPSYQNQQIGTKILNFVIYFCKKEGIQKIKLGMIDDNKKLKKWYEKFGFKTIETIQYDKAPYLVGKMEKLM